MFTLRWLFGKKWIWIYIVYGYIVRAIKMYTPMCSSNLYFYFFYKISFLFPNNLFGKLNLNVINATDKTMKLVLHWNELLDVHKNVVSTWLRSRSNSLWFIMIFLITSYWKFVIFLAKNSTFEYVEFISQCFINSHSHSHSL